jgi:hypothetical protein
MLIVFDIELILEPGAVAVLGYFYDPQLWLVKFSESAPLRRP